jgi:hypothetical protein
MSDQSINYYDLTTTGVGFINRFRKVKPDQGDPYYSVTIAAMRGKANNEGHVQKTFIDCNVVGDATLMAKQLETFFDDENKPKVMVKFVFGDLEHRAFPYKSGERKGQTGYALKGRLFDIKWYKVNGDTTVYSVAEMKRHEQQTENSSDHQINDSAKKESSITGNSESKQSDTVQVELPKEVKLVNDDPYYEERESQLIEQGYQYQGSSMWLLSEAAA